MLRSLVGSEMCIRDRTGGVRCGWFSVSERRAFQGRSEVSVLGTCWAYLELGFLVYEARDAPPYAAAADLTFSHHAHTPHAHAACAWPHGAPRPHRTIRASHGYTAPRALTAPSVPLAPSPRHPCLSRPHRAIRASRASSRVRRRPSKARLARRAARCVCPSGSWREHELRLPRLEPRLLAACCLLLLAAERRAAPSPPPRAATCA